MGSSGGGTSTTTQGLPAWLLPYAKQFINAYAGQVFPGGQLQTYPPALNQQVAPFTADQLSAMSNLQGIVPQEQALAGLGAGQAGQTISGAYLYPQTNPFLDATFNAAAQGLVNQYQIATAPSTMAAAQHAGQMGSTAFDQQRQFDQYGLGQNLQNLAANIYGTNYSNERANQLAQINQLPTTLSAMTAPQTTLLGVGSLQQQQAQTGLDTATQNAINQFQFPFNLLSGLGGAIGQAGGGAGTSTTKVSQGK